MSGRGHSLDPHIHAPVRLSSVILDQDVTDGESQLPLFTVGPDDHLQPALVIDGVLKVRSRVLTNSA